MSTKLTREEVKKITDVLLKDTDIFSSEDVDKISDIFGVSRRKICYHLNKLGYKWDNVHRSENDFALTASVADVVAEQDPEKRAVAKKKVWEKMIVFLAKARLVAEVERKFGVLGLECFEEMMNNSPEGYSIKTTQNQYREETYYLEPNLPVFTGEVNGKRVFSIIHSENDRAYIAVVFPRELDFSDDKRESAIRIIPIDSVHYGDYLCDEDRFKEVLRRAASKEYVFLFLNGDIIGGSKYEKHSAVGIREQLKTLLAPVAHKILWAQSGGLERRMMKIDGVDPLQNVCEELGIFHSGSQPNPRPISADIYWKEPMNPITVYAIHGRSNAIKDGSKLNAVVQTAQAQSFPDITIMGHVKEAMTDDLLILRPNPSVDNLEEQTAYVVVCPGFLKYQGSDGEVKGYPPPVSGRVECIIHPDNRVEVSS